MVVVGIDVDTGVRTKPKEPTADKRVSYKLDLKDYDDEGRRRGRTQMAAMTSATESARCLVTNKNRVSQIALYTSP